MSTTNPDHATTATAVAALLDGVRAEHLSAPTPCPEYNVAALLDHFMGLTLAFTWVARKENDKLTDDPPHARAEDLHPDWRRLLPLRLADMVAAWRESSAWEGQAKAAGVDMPTQIWGLVALNELVVHGWDLARATGQPYQPDPAALDVAIELMGQDADDPQARDNDGGFGRVVLVSDDSPALDKAIGLSGRDPAWTPPGGRG
ncbi:MAG: TIGR03086 family metal-binding protein [Stackebrandtia sp.]